MKTVFDTEIHMFSLFQEKTEFIMRAWLDIYQSPKQHDPTAIKWIFAQLEQIGIFTVPTSLSKLATRETRKSDSNRLTDSRAAQDICDLRSLASQGQTDGNFVRFFRLATVFIIERALKNLKIQEQLTIGSSTIQQQQPQQQQASAISSATWSSLGSSMTPNPSHNGLAPVSLMSVGPTGFQSANSLPGGVATLGVNSASSARIQSFTELDAYACLIGMIIKRTGAGQGDAVTKVS
ncbi:unnamed protein product [Protopolystoma xenopodis]|uniref:Uncharacterized protein n=1 Tax=Protopolystoma xenopodis TaxID=117903 RepID=A0A448WJY2_9PLAT|nr:unnamed protein product [Protopolystoma xenopodis]